MKIIYMGVLRNDSKPALELALQLNLGSFNYFTQGSIGEFAHFFAKQVAERTGPDVRQDVEEKGYICHAYGRSEGICGIIISDTDYPFMVAQSLLSKIVDEFLSKYPRSAFANATKMSLSYPELKDYIVKYQDPEQADSIMKIQKELDETKKVIHKTIESMMERGEKMENLVQKSGDLSAQSKLFYTQAKKQNSCCIVM